MTREEMHKKMAALIEITEPVDDAITFTDEAIALISEIAAWAKETGFYKNNREKAKAFFENAANPSDIWIFMLQKIVGAPTMFHRDCVVAGYMPALDAAVTKNKLTTGKKE